STDGTVDLYIEGKTVNATGAYNATFGISNPSANAYLTAIATFKAASTTKTKTQTAKARITALATKTSSALARITATTTKTITALARVTAIATKTQTAIARITALATKT